MNSRNHRVLAGLSLLVIWVSAGLTAGQKQGTENTHSNPYTRWRNGPPHESTFFPIGVWLQNPSKARQYQSAGFNTYIALWKGPTESQLAALKAAGMHVVCQQNAVGLRHVDDSTIIGWMHGDEPDNAQSLGKGKGYGPPIPPERIIRDYDKIRTQDPSRPVLLNLGQGVAWDQWHGRGVRTNHPEDYAEYVKGCDIASFDIYPVVHPNPAVSGKLWYVGRGVRRLMECSDGDKVIWNCIECTRIQHATAKPTPRQVRSEVWMSIIHGSMGLIYFVHEWTPAFNESALLSDPEMLQAVTAINRHITALAPVLNSRSIDDAVSVSSENNDVPIETMLKEHEGSTYLFAVAMRDGRSTVTFRLNGLHGRRAIEVLGEDRTLASVDGRFEDDFESYDVHLYRVR